MTISEAYHIDCMEYMKTIPDNFFDLALADPNYGRKEDGGVDRSGYVTQKNGDKIFVKSKKHKKKNWDQKPAGEEFFNELFRVSKDQIIWGCNYYEKNFGPGRIIWDKCNEGSDQSDCEIAYNSLTNRVDLFRFMWRGMMQGKSASEGHIMQGNKSLNEKRIHPTQKGVVLYRWQLQKYAKPGWKIFDPMMGSQSCRIACYEEGFDFWGCEIDEDYYNEGYRRYNEHKYQYKLF